MLIIDGLGGMAREIPPLGSVAYNNLVSGLITEWAEPTPVLCSVRHGQYFKGGFGETK